MVEFNELDNIAPESTIDSLKKKQLSEVQRALAFICYPVGVIDGEFGPRTRSAWGEFKEDIGEGNPSLVSASSLRALKSKIHATNKKIDVALDTDARAKKAIGQVCEALGLGLKTQIAYVLATTQWETAHTFKPVKEAFWLSETWRRNNLRYFPYYGRGYVQLTWKRNYKNYSDILGLDMVRKPDLALEGQTALFVLVHGFKMGTFTGRHLREFIDERRTDFKNARRCINGLDKWADIKELAERHLAEL